MRIPPLDSPNGSSRTDAARPPRRSRGADAARRVAAKLPINLPVMELSTFAASTGNATADWLYRRWYDAATTRRATDSVPRGATVASFRGSAQRLRSDAPEEAAGAQEPHD